MQQHVDAIQAVVDHQQSLVDSLSTTPVTADEQGAAAAFIDATRRSVVTGTAYVEAIRTSDPQADAIGAASSLDLDLSAQIASDHAAPSCA